VSDVLERVRALIALSASPEKGEASNAAEAACRLIREHKIELSLSREGPREEWSGFSSEGFAGNRSPHTPGEKSTVELIGDLFKFIVETGEAKERTGRGSGRR
jgi:hypothetical protein